MYEPPNIYAIYTAFSSTEPRYEEVYLLVYPYIGCEYLPRSAIGTWVIRFAQQGGQIYYHANLN